MGTELDYCLATIESDRKMDYVQTDDRRVEFDPVELKAGATYRIYLEGDDVTVLEVIAQRVGRSAPVN